MFRPLFLDPTIIAEEKNGRLVSLTANKISISQRTENELVIYPATPKTHLTVTETVMKILSHRTFQARIKTQVQRIICCCEDCWASWTNNRLARQIHLPWVVIRFV